MQYNIYSSPPAIILKSRNPLFTKPSPSHSSSLFTNTKYTEYLLYINKVKTKHADMPHSVLYTIKKAVPPNPFNKILPLIAFE